MPLIELIELSKAKPNKKKSLEYLEAALEAAKKMLPGWQYAVIHRAAFPSSGGRARRNRRLTATEKAWIENTSVREMNTSELRTVLHTLNRTLSAYRRQGKDTKAVVARSRSVTEEMRRREVEVEGGAAEDFRKSYPEVLPEGETVELQKGFVNGEPEGGMHAHGLDRLNSKTLVDGNHLHLFVVPGTGEVIITEEDGQHAHAIEDSGNRTSVDGQHYHAVRLGNGQVLETKLGGEHSHELMVETSGFSGLHKHVLRLPDGTEVESLTPGEFISRFVDVSSMLTGAIYSAREVTNALNESRTLRDQFFDDRLPTLSESVDLVAKGGEAPTPPPTLWEVEELANGGAHCSLSGMETPMLLSNPFDLHLAEGDIVEVSSGGQILKHADSSEPHEFEEAEAIATYADELEKATKAVEFSGPQSAPLVFVSASPSPLEMARKEAITGPDGALFSERYLKPLGLTKAEVAAGFAVPVSCPNPTSEEIDLWRARLLKSLAVYDSAKVIALGRVAKEALGELASFSLPHPAALRRHGDRGELDRKLRSICKTLDISQKQIDPVASPTEDPSHGESGATLADSISELGDAEDLRVAVTKSVEEKQIVYGVILDPYQVDLHNDWIPPAEIESTAHDFLAKSRVIGLHHKGPAEAKVVESWVEVYPSEKDRELALNNMPHKVWRRQFGSDVLHSGAWVAGVQLSDELWELHKKGELDAFSIGGFSFKTKVSTEAMPEVEFLDLQ